MSSITEYVRDDPQDFATDGALKFPTSLTGSLTQSKHEFRDSTNDTPLEPSMPHTHGSHNPQDSSIDSVFEGLASLSHIKDDPKDSTMDRLFEASSSFKHAREISLVGALDGPPPHQQGEWLSIHNEEDAIENVKMIQLTLSDHSYVCQAIGATSLDESHTLLYTKSFWWPPRGLPDGLYKDVISARFLSQCRYHACSVFFNFSLVAQLIIGAIITALSASKPPQDFAITVIAACNTVNAGLLALINGSGAPDRYKNDAVEFEKVEKFLEEIMYGRIVKEGVTREHVIAECFDRYAKARATQAANKSSTYTATIPNKNGITASARN